MDSPHSGSRNEVVKLLQVETDLFSLYIQGKPFHPTVQALHLHRTDEDDFVEAKLSIHPYMASLYPLSTKVYSPQKNMLVDHLMEATVPLFYETQSYTLVIRNKTEHILGVRHDHPQIQNAVQSHDNLVLSGTINFGSEVGFTDLHITVDGAPALTINLEIFPAKLDYKTDYETILRDVNEQIYNLSFDFMRKTYHLSGLRDTPNQAMTEYFTILKHIFSQLVSSVERIQDAPHHKLDPELHVRDAALVKRAGKANMKYLSRNLQHLIKDSNGVLLIQGDTYRPEKLIESKRRLSFNTTENRFLKWMLERIDRKLKQLGNYLQTSDRQTSPDLFKSIGVMRNQVRRLLQFDFIREAGMMQQMSVTLVLQMAPGYRDAYRIHLMLMKGLAIQSDLFHISLKNLALLYEYWCFLKIHHLLSKKYKLVSQDVIKVKHSGVLVLLDQSSSAKIIYENPQTHERFELFYNNVTTSTKDFPTLSQRPDNVLTITKRDTQRNKRIYKYIFDAKYRIDPAYPGTPYFESYKAPGPVEEDINTMHRYRDAIVYQEDLNGTFERSMFGAYVLFPYGDEAKFKEHRFYKSIELINIGAFPFLPNATGLMEKFLDELIMDSPEKAYERSTRPRGTEEYYRDKLSGKNALVVAINGAHLLKACHHSLTVELPLAMFSDLKVLSQIQRVALYHPKGHFRLHNQGIHHFGYVRDWQIIRKKEQFQEESLIVQFQVSQWLRMDERISPGAYHLNDYILTSTYLLERAHYLEELKIESDAVLSMWRELRRQGKVFVELDHVVVDQATVVKRIGLRAK